MSPRPYKRCSCGVEMSREDWIKLPLCGVQRFGRGIPDLELRNHPTCGSTIGVIVNSK